MHFHLKKIPTSRLKGIIAVEDQILDINTFEVVKVSYEMGIVQVIFEVSSLVTDIVADGEERPWI